MYQKRKSNFNILEKLKESRVAGPGRVIFRYLIGNWPEWLGLLLLLFALGIAVNSIQQAQWVDPQPSLLTVLSFSLILGVMLAKSRLPLAGTISISIIGGIIVTIWQSTRVLPSPADGNIFSRLIPDLSSLWQTLSQNSPEEVTLHFTIFLIVITWILGYVSTWLFLRKHSVWPALSMGLVVLLVNLDYLTKSDYGYFFFYLFGAILLVSYTGFLKQHFSFRQHHVKYPLRGVFWFLALVLCINAIFIGGSWAAPEIHSNRLQNVTDTRLQLGNALDHLSINVFAPVRAKGDIIKSQDQHVLHFSSPPNLSRDIHFQIISPEAPVYWRVRRYDIYNSWGWSTGPLVEDTTGSGASQEIVTPADHSQLTFTVVNKIRTDVVLSAGQYVASEGAVTAYSFLQVDNASAPVDEIAFLTTPRLYKFDESYTVINNIISPTADQLSEAGIQYPYWIVSRYLQLPGDLPKTVIRLGQTITKGSRTPYDKVIAVKEYLEQFTYVENGTFPPPGFDAVDNFLSIQKAGNCTNFATAGVVLLRSAGVPARFCTGYIPRSRDDKQGIFNVEARDYHAWPEVYFPEYGWVEFEFTPGSVQELIVPEDYAYEDIQGISENISDYFFIYGESAVSSGETENYHESAIPQQDRTRSFPTPVVILLFIAVGIMFGLRRWNRRFERENYASEIYARLRFWTSLMKLAPGPQQTPFEFGANLTRLLPAQREPIANVTRAYADSRFGGIKEIDIKKKQELRHAWNILFRAILKRRLLRL